MIAEAGIVIRQAIMITGFVFVMIMLFLAILIGNTGTIPVYLVGDANKVGNAQDAIHEAYELAKTL